MLPVAAMRMISFSSAESKMKKLSALLKKVDGEVHAELVCTYWLCIPTCNTRACRTPELKSVS